MTTACIGWETDEPCAVWGQFHGCKHPADHPGQHECDCGATSGPTSNKHAAPPPCGTTPAYWRHRRYRQPVCPACQQAYDERKQTKQPAA